MVNQNALEVKLQKKDEYIYSLDLYTKKFKEKLELQYRIKIYKSKNDTARLKRTEKSLKNIVKDLVNLGKNVTMDLDDYIQADFENDLDNG